MTPLFQVQASGWPFIAHNRIGLSCFWAAITPSQNVGSQWNRLEAQLVGLGADTVAPLGEGFVVKLRRRSSSSKGHHKHSEKAPEHFHSSSKGATTGAARILVNLGEKPSPWPSNKIPRCHSLVKTQPSSLPETMVKRILVVVQVELF